MQLTAYVQLTALLTPALAMAAGEKPAKSVWLGCLFAMAGTILLTLDNAPRVAPPANAAHIAIGEAPCFLTNHGDFSAYDSWPCWCSPEVFRSSAVVQQLSSRS